MKTRVFLSKCRVEDNQVKLSVYEAVDESGLFDGYPTVFIAHGSGYQLNGHPDKLVKLVTVTSEAPIELIESLDQHPEIDLLDIGDPFEMIDGDDAADIKTRLGVAGFDSAIVDTAQTSLEILDSVVLELNPLGNKSLPFYDKNRSKEFT